MTIWKGNSLKKQLNTAGFQSSFLLEKFGKNKLIKDVCCLDFGKTKPNMHPTYVLQLSPGLLAQQAGKAPCGPLRWLLQYSCANGNHYSSLQDTSWVHRALLVPCRNLEAEQEQACTRTNSFFHRQKERLKPSDKNHFFSPLEKTTKQPKVAYAANLGSAQGITWDCSRLQTDLKLLQYPTEKKKGSIENTKLFSFEILYSYHHSPRTTHNLTCQVYLPHFATADHRGASQRSLSTHQ